MKWYSVKKYRPPRSEYCFVVSGGEIALANYEVDSWSVYCPITNSYRELTDITHFCIPDPIEIEE